MALGGHDPIEPTRRCGRGRLARPTGCKAPYQGDPARAHRLAVATALRVGLWNIGGEGQLIAGAIAANRYRPLCDCCCPPRCSWSR